MQAFEPMFSEQGSNLRNVYLPQELKNRPGRSDQSYNEGRESSFFAALDTDIDVSSKFDIAIWFFF